MSKLRSVFMVFFTISTLCLLSGCNQENKDDNLPKIKVIHELGQSELSENPQKVVVFNTATLDTMDAMDIKIVGVPQSGVTLPDYLAKYKTKEYVNVGTLFEPDYEVLSQIDPDLIVSGGRTADSYIKLSKIAPTIAIGNKSAQFRESLMNAITELGLIFHKEEIAQSMIEKFNEKIEVIQAITIKKAEQNEANALVLMINGGKFANFGAGSRFGFIFDSLGFTTAQGLSQKDKAQHGNVLSAELIAKVNPDWLFVINRDNAVGANQTSSEVYLKENPLIIKTKAWEKGQIIYINSAEVYLTGGYQAYMRLMDQILEALNKN